MQSRTLKALEFGKVLEHLAACCVSEAGKNVCAALSPLEDVSRVAAAHKLFEEVRVWRATGGVTFQAFPELEGLLLLFEGGATAIADADAFWALRGVLNLAKEAVRSILTGGANWPTLAELAGAFPLPELTLSALNRCISDDGLLKDESSPELFLVRGEVRRLHQSCLRKVKEFAVRYNISQYLQDEFMTLASDRYVLPLKANFKGRVQGIVHDYSNTGETCYFEPLFLVEHNNRLQELKREEREEERKVLAMLTDLARREAPFVRAAWDLLVRLDVELAKCAFADRLDAHCATPGGPGEPLSLLAARHPLLALDPAVRAAGGPQPVDLTLRAEDRALVISGGNAGGKTVCLKTLGLLVAMTLAGLPVPAARGSVAPMWPDIHAFIGDEQSLDDHLSTFTAQIRHLATAWESTGPGSLILLDEFGAGTAPAQGAALAQSVLDALTERGACVVAATHFPALKTYALTREGVRAASVLLDPATQKPLFRLAYDQVGASRALDVARAHGLPENVLRGAEHYLLLDGEDMSAVLDRLNALAARRENELASLAAEREKTIECRKRVQERLERERNRLAAEVRDVSARITREWEAGRIAHKQALRELAKVRTELRAAAAQAPEEGEGVARNTLDLAALKPGQSVTHRPWNKRAVVREVDVRQQRVKLDLNGVSLWADAALLDPVQEKGAGGRAAGSAAGARPTSPEIASLRLDLRGKRADLALSELERYIDRALLAGREGVEIVHGRGTGALRREVHALLRSHPGVADFGLAPEDQGGDGVTVATFK